MLIEKENPYTYFDGLIGWPCLGLFVKFYKDLGVLNTQDVRAKRNVLEKKILTDDDINDVITSYEVTPPWILKRIMNHI